MDDASPVAEPSPVAREGAPPLPRSEFVRTEGTRAVRRLLQGTRPVTWVFTGDSIVHGAQHTAGRRSYSEHFAERVRWELRRLSDVVINTGVSGERAGSLLQNLDWRATRFRPDVVSVTIGLNDAVAGLRGRGVFRDQLCRIMDSIQSHGAVGLLNTPNAISRKHAKRYADLSAYVDVIRDVAETKRVTLIDHWEHWTHELPNAPGRTAWLAGDGIHPGIDGHRELSCLLFRALGIFDTGSPTCVSRVKR